MKCLAPNADAIVVGARCAGSAAAIALARAGRRVVVLDRASFPSDTLSTHLLFAGGVAELQALGALEAVKALGAPELPEAEMTAAGYTVKARYTPVDGVGYGMCVRRPGLDQALVDAARAAGAEVRERTKVTGLLRDGDRVVGVETGEGEELRAALVVGADGRGSTVARLAGAETPYRRHANGRACCFAYWEDAQPEQRHIAAQWREGQDLGTAFPCDDGLLLVLLMPPRDRPVRAEDYEQLARSIPGLGERLEGARVATKVRVATDLPSYFRRSGGPGWALPGDAGHFKDPVTAQGIRDALRYGRLLGEAAAPVLEDPARLDRALARWERTREAECLETYRWTNQLARARAITPVELELYRAASEDPAQGDAMLDVFSRTRLPSEALPVHRGARLAARAWRRPQTDRRALAGEIGDALSLAATRRAPSARRAAW